jgi:hypothetical protein
MAVRGRQRVITAFVTVPSSFPSIAARGKWDGVRWKMGWPQRHVYRRVKVNKTVSNKSMALVVLKFALRRIKPTSRISGDS